MIETTAQSLITSTFKLIGVLASSEVPTSSEIQDAFHTLNALVDEWAVHRLTMPSLLRSEFPLTVGQQSYTVGLAGDFTVAPPLTLDHINLLLPVDTATPRTEKPLSLLTQDGYAAVRIKELESSLPTVAWYNPTTAPLGTIWFWPVPMQTGLEVVVYTPVDFAQFTSLTAPVSLHAGYYKALRYNLALELAAEYGIQPRQDITDMAMKTLSAIKRVNLVMTDLEIPFMGCGSAYNILTDEGA